MRNRGGQRRGLTGRVFDLFDRVEVAFFERPAELESRLVGAVMLVLSVLVALTASDLGRPHFVHLSRVYILLFGVAVFSLGLLLLPVHKLNESVARGVRTGIAFSSLALLMHWTGGLASPYVPLYFVLVGVAGFFEPLPWTMGLIAAVIVALALPSVTPTAPALSDRLLAVWPISLVLLFMGISTRSLGEFIRTSNHIFIMQHHLERDLSGLEGSHITLAKVFDAAGLLLGTDRCFYFDRQGDTLVGSDGFNIDMEEFRRVRIGLSEISVCSETVRTLEVVAVDDVSISPVVKRSLAQAYGAKSVIAVPLIGEVGCEGVLLFADSKKVRHFTSADVSVARLLGREASLALVRARAYEGITLEQRRFTRLAAAVADGVFELDEQGRIAFWNEAAVRLTGYSSSEAMGSDWHELTECRVTDPDFPSAQRVSVESVGEKGELTEIDLLCKLADGSRRWLSLRLSPLFEADSSRTTGYLCSFRDVTDRKTRELSSSIDELTGVYNRRFCYERLIEETERVKRSQTRLSLLMVDLDDFRHSNERFGHAAGDEVLREVSRRMLQVLRRIDVLCRYGGDEFLVILPETDRAGARTSAGRIRRAIAAAPVAVDGGTIRITASVGAATMKRGDLTGQDELIRLADSAMYAAKKAGKNTTRPAA